MDSQSDIMLVKSMGSLGNLPMSIYGLLKVTPIETIFYAFINSIKNKRKIIRDKNKNNFICDNNYRWLSIVLKNLYEFKNVHKLEIAICSCSKDLTIYINNLADPLQLIINLIDIFNVSTDGIGNNNISKEDYMNLYNVCVGKAPVHIKNKKSNPRYTENNDFITEVIPKSKPVMLALDEPISEHHRNKNPDSKTVVANYKTPTNFPFTNVRKNNQKDFGDKKKNFNSDVNKKTWKKPELY